MLRSSKSSGKIKLFIGSTMNRWTFLVLGGVALSEVVF
jgi:hypothetical protein